MLDRYGKLEYALGIERTTWKCNNNHAYKHVNFYTFPCRDTLIFAATNSGTSIFSGFVIFSVLGYMAHVQGIEDVGLVAESGMCPIVLA